MKWPFSKSVGDGNVDVEDSRHFQQRPGVEASILWCPLLLSHQSACLMTALLVHPLVSPCNEEGGGQVEVRWRWLCCFKILLWPFSCRGFIRGQF